jgi:hypothetical protein
MKRLTISLAIAGLAALAVVATVSAASPTPPPTPATEQVRTRDTLPDVLGLSQAEIMDLRHDGLTLAQIAERQKIDPQVLVDTLVAQWSERIDARVANGALTADDAAALKTQLALQAKAMVNQAAAGGMRGAAVGAGPGAAARGGSGAGMGRGAGVAGGGMGYRAGGGTGICDGTGPNGSATP